MVAQPREIEPTADNPEMRITYIPQRMQGVFHTCPAREIIYGGSAGGGKSMALLNDFVNRAMAFHGYRSIIFRRTSSELQEMRDNAYEMLYGRGVAAYNGDNDRWWFHETGSYVAFSHLQQRSDVLKHKGKGYTDIGFDEMTDFLPEQIEYLKTRNRTTMEGQIARIVGGTNPGGVAHVYLKNSYIEPCDEYGNLLTNVRLLYRYSFELEQWVRFPPGTRGQPEKYVVWQPDLTEDMRLANEFRALEGLPSIEQPSRCFIPAHLKDNKYLYAQGDYHARLAAIKDENQRKALLDGSWDLYEGQFFSGFNPKVHVITTPVRPDDLPGWRFWRSVDWGWREPFCALWHAQDPETQEIITFDEIYQTQLPDREQARRIRDRWPNTHFDATFADRSSYWRGDSYEDAATRADIYEAEDVLLTPANNARVDGWSRVRDLMAINPATGRPWWRVASTCRNLIRTIPQMIYSEHNPEDIDTDAEDHAVDSLRYGLMDARSLNARNTPSIEIRSRRWR